MSALIELIDRLGIDVEKQETLDIKEILMAAKEEGIITYEEYTLIIKEIESVLNAALSEVKKRDTVTEDNYTELVNKTNNFLEGLNK